MISCIASSRESEAVAPGLSMARLRRRYSSLWLHAGEPSEQMFDSLGPAQRKCTTRRIRSRLGSPLGVDVAEQTQPLHPLRLSHSGLPESGTERGCHPRLLIGARFPDLDDNNRAVAATADVGQ